MKRNGDRLRDLWDNIKHNNIHTIHRIRKERKMTRKIFEEIMVENVPNMGMEIIN